MFIENNFVTVTKQKSIYSFPFKKQISTKLFGKKTRSKVRINNCFAIVID